MFGIFEVVRWCSTPISQNLTQPPAHPFNLVSLMADARRSRHRSYGRTNAKGRSANARFVKLEHWFLKSEAWKSMGAVPRALYVELSQRYNGYNNGEISMSVREAKRLLHVAKDTAAKAFHELEDKGFAKRAVCGSFNWKLRHATQWILTEHPLGDSPGTKDFASWHDENLKAGPDSGPGCPKTGTGRIKPNGFESAVVLLLGPLARLCIPPRSQITARI